MRKIQSKAVDLSLHLSPPHVSVTYSPHMSAVVSKAALSGAKNVNSVCESGGGTEGSMHAWGGRYI